MGAGIEQILLGILIVILGFNNMKGNISSLHRYHRKRVAEEDRVPFGRMVGLGTIICGASLFVNGCLSLVTEKTQITVFSSIGGVILVLGLVIGIAISLWAIIKYNKGIF